MRWEHVPSRNGGGTKMTLREKARVGVICDRMKVQKTHSAITVMQPTLVRKVHSDSHKQPWHQVAKTIRHCRTARRQSVGNCNITICCVPAYDYYKAASFASQTTISPRTYGICHIWQLVHQNAWCPPSSS